MNHMSLANQAAKRMLTSTRPKQTGNTILKHLKAFLAENKEAKK